MEQHAVVRIPSLGSTVGVGKHNFTILRGDAGKGTFRMVCATTAKKWTCEAEVVLDCHDKVSSRIFTLSNEHPVYNDLRHSCHCAGVPNLLLTVAIREEQIQVTKTNSKDPSANKRFTDEADAKKLNANCRILFDGSPEPLFVNRHLLAIYSTVFRAMFEGEYKEKDAEEIAISNLKKEDFLAFLECLYHPVVPVDEKNIEAVLLVADRYHFEYLIDACKKHMLETNLVGGAQHKRYIAMAARYRLEDVMKTILGTFPPATVAELLEPQFMKELMDVNYEAASFILTQAAQKTRMSECGVVFLKELNDEEDLGFLCFTALYEDEHECRVTASLNNDADEDKCAEWTCSIVMALYCLEGNCGKASQHHFILTSADPSSIISTDLNCAGCEGDLSFILYVSIQDAEEIAKMELESQIVDTTYRFTDEAEAKKLNANCKICFEDSNTPVYVNRELLAVYSDVFRAMFEGNFKEKDAEEVKLEVDREDFLLYLDCLYFPAVPVAVHNFKAVAIIADRYHCPQLLEKCKKFAEERAKTASQIEECKDYIEVAERLGWDHVMTAVIETMKKEGVSFLMQVLDCDWIDERSKNTRRALFAEIKGVVSSDKK